MTNGEKLEEIFPNVEISPNPYSPSVDIHVGGIMMMRIDRNWWNAEYKEPTTKNDLGVDAISRQAVLDLIADYDLSMGQVVRGIHALPSVTPQPRKGHWILGGYDEYYYICDRCKFVASEYYAKPKFHYCPNCGAKMVESQESEEEE